jgi:tricarballylate dehydrogenase
MRAQRESTTKTVVVVGGGNAGLVAAIAAAEDHCNVRLFEAAPSAERGGNSSFTLGGVRVAFEDPESIFQLLSHVSESEAEMIRRRPYPAASYLADLLTLSQGEADEALCSLLVRWSLPVVKWMKGHGINWGLYMSGFAPEPLWIGSPGNLYAEGGGKGLVAALERRTKSLGVSIEFDHSLEEILLDDTGSVRGITIMQGAEQKRISCDMLVLACGGFEANEQLRRRHLGPAWASMKVRGTRFNTGKGIEAALRIGAQRHGQWDNGHAVPIAFDAPEFGSLALGTTTRRCLFQFGISVDRDGRRFMDEGQNRKTFMYSTTGVAVASQTDGFAYQIFDATFFAANFEKAYYLSGQHYKANTLRDLAASVGIPPDQFLREIEEYNAAIQAGGTFDPNILDGCATVGITPKRSNYATAICEPPFFAFKVVGGITFTYGGLKIDQQCRVLDGADQPIRGLFAAGEVTGGFFAHCYPSNSGLMRGAVTGYLAAKSASRDLKDLVVQS